MSLGSPAPARRSRGPRRPPGPRGHPLVGDLDAYQADRLGWLRRAHCEFGDLVRITPSMTVVNHPDVAHEVLAATDDRFLLDTATLAGRRHRAAQARRLADWMRLRRHIWHGFADRLEGAHLARFGVLADAGLKELANATDADGRPEDLVTACRRLCGRMIVDFCLGGDPSDAADLPDAADRANALFVAGLDILASGETRLPLLPKPRATAASAASAELVGLLGHWVARRRAADWSGEPRDLLDALLVGTGSGDHDLVVRALRTAMFASHGVPGAGLAWIVLRLAGHPDVAARIAEEAPPSTAGEPATPGRPPELALPYTVAVVAETLRLHPPQWLLSRTVQEPTDVGGYRFRAGHEILVCPYLIHRDPRWWERAGQFDPERWLQADGGSEAPRRPHARHAYLPFGAGPRHCPGSALARTQLALLAGLLARDHTLADLPSTEDVDVTCEGLLVPAGVRGGWHAGTL